MNRLLDILFGLFALLILLLLAQSTQASETWKNPIDGMEYVRIPAGEFDAKIETSNNQDSLITVKISSDFWMASREVSVEQFSNFVQDTGYITTAELDSNRFNWRSPGFQQAKDHPVVYISFKDANAYAEWTQVDIPTQQEWLYACHAGSKKSFFWGDTMDNRYCWHRGNTKGISTRPVATTLPNQWDLYDMVGNVWEYVTVCEERFILKGASWTRCAQYKSRQGPIAEMIPSSVERRIFRCEKPQWAPYPWDDDRGIRCVKRIDD